VATERSISKCLSSSVELDRVTGGLGPSEIFGNLTSNGILFLVNPNGILFGQGAQINVGSLLATAHDIKNSDFIAGNYNFSSPGNASASVVNQGSITAASGGFAALVAPGVRNTGTITATLGTVGLAASGQGFTLDMYGDKLITLAVGDNIASQVTDVSSGQPLTTLVSNEGKISAIFIGPFGSTGSSPYCVSIPFGPRSFTVDIRILRMSSRAGLVDPPKALMLSPPRVSEKSAALAPPPAPAMR
jgi:filamentous hemagglutinin family protein